MCGICGQFRFDSENVSSKSLTSMMSKLARRGPDSNGKWLEGKIGFGHQRLSIIDLSFSIIIRSCAAVRENIILSKRIIWNQQRFFGIAKL